MSLSKKLHSTKYFGQILWLLSLKWMKGRISPKNYSLIIRMLNQFKGTIGKNEGNFVLSLFSRAIFHLSKLGKHAGPLIAFQPCRVPAIYPDYFAGSSSLLNVAYWISHKKSNQYRDVLGFCHYTFSIQARIRTWQQSQQWITFERRNFRSRGLERQQLGFEPRPLSDLFFYPHETW